MTGHNVAIYTTRLITYAGDADTACRPLQKLNAMWIHNANADHASMPLHNVSLVCFINFFHLSLHDVTDIMTQYATLLDYIYVSTCVCS